MIRFVAASMALVLLLGFASGQSAGAPSSSQAGATDLRVLFVGQDPENLKVMFSDMAVPRTHQLYRERTAAWEALLRYHFAHVTVVHGEEYRVEMSDAVDVTIFDVPPKELTKAQRGKDSVTGKSFYKAASYLPESFDRPAILIGANAPRIGEPIGLKLDWL